MNFKSDNFGIKLVLFLFVITLTIGSYLRLSQIEGSNFAFTMDQARDMLDIREIVVGLHPTLIGPTTSINGVFLGPFYYYFNVLPFLISQGNPVSLVYWNILWYILAAGIIFWFSFKKDKMFALISSAVFIMAPAFFEPSRFFWSANPMPYVTAFYFLLLVALILRRDAKTSFMAGLIAGLAMQFEAAFGILFFPFLIIYSLIRKVPWRTLILAFIGFLITLMPQILFELRHDFLMSKTFFKEIAGQSGILGERLGFIDAQISHLRSFTEITVGNFEFPSVVSWCLILISTGYLLLKIKRLGPLRREFFLSSFTFIIFSIIFYSWFLHPLKGWYLLGLRVPFIFIAALFLSEIFGLRGRFSKLAVIGLLLYSFASTFTLQSSLIPGNLDLLSGDKSSLRNEIVAINWVYDKAAGQGFKAYNYIPSVYDYPYQYLYWWYGMEKYGYHPETVTYKEGVPEYIKDNDKFFSNKRPLTAEPLIFLIYETDERPQRLSAWLGDFTEYCTLEKESFVWGTTVELRKLCK